MALSETFLVTSFYRKKITTSMLSAIPAFNGIRFFFKKKIEPSNWLANIRIATCLNINLHLQAANSECTLLPYLNFQGSKLVLYKVPMKCFLNNPANKNIA